MTYNSIFCFSFFLYLTQQSVVVSYPIFGEKKEMLFFINIENDLLHYKSQ